MIKDKYIHIQLKILFIKSIILNKASLLLQHVLFEFVVVFA
jgi:hypothetical protein